MSSLCCQGVYSLNAAYKSVDDRRGACQSIKDRAVVRTKDESLKNTSGVKRIKEGVK